MSGSEVHRLDLFLGETRIGILTFKPADEQFTLTYSDHWQQHGFALSPQLPLDGTAESIQIAHFLNNLLPEADALERLTRWLAISRSNTFGLITALGHDTSGAVSFTVPGTAAFETSFREISPEELQQHLELPERFPLEVWDDRPRLSVAGVQAKLNLFIQGCRFGFGEGALCSTHIMKFEGQHRHLVLNEYITMQLARAAGFEVAEVSLLFVGDRRVLVTKRFDRKFDAEDNRVLRRHMIDACQALGLPVSRKYERNFGDGRDVRHIREGVSLKQLFALTSLCTNPARAALNLLQWVLFNLCVSNCDAHGKNFSFFVSREGLNPTPWYDLVNISLYPQFSQNLAMAVGDEFTLDDIHTFQLALFAEECNIERKLLESSLKKLCLSLPQHLDGVLKTVTDLSGEEKKYALRYREGIISRCHWFLTQAEGLSTVSL